MGNKETNNIRQDDEINVEDNPEPIDEETAKVMSLPQTTTKRGLKSRHAQMIALGGTIGTGLFVNSGQVLALGGPLFLLLSYGLITILLYGVATATGEMSSYLPVQGCSIPYFATRFVSPSLGFAMGWMYWYAFAIQTIAEVEACALVIEYWNPPISSAVWITVTLVIITILNCFPVKIYGETEFWFASLKIFTIIGLIILSIVLFFGGGPKHEPLYFHMWGKPGPVKEHIVSGASGRLCAFLGTLPSAFYAFAFAPELLVATGGEMRNPRQNIPKATKRYIYRLVIFYIIGALCISVIVSSDNPNLLGQSSDAGSSPWAIAIKEAGIHSLDSVINTAILLSAWSAGNSYFYLTTRMLYSMAMSGSAPRIFARTTVSGIPYWATLASFLWMPIAYLNVSKSGGTTVFNWFVNLTNTAGYESWICCCIIYPYTAYISGCGFFLLMLLVGFQVFLKDQWDISVFLSSYIGIPAFVAIYLGHKLTVGRADPLFIDPEVVDLFTGLEDIMEPEASSDTKPAKWYMKWTRILW